MLSDQLPPLMERVRSVLRKSYFHGDISTRDAEGQLAGKQVGTFLVRFSTSSPGFYTNNRAYASLEDLINQNARELNLISACLGSRFSALFVEQSISGYVQ